MTPKSVTVLFIHFFLLLILLNNTGVSSIQPEAGTGCLLKHEIKSKKESLQSLKDQVKFCLYTGSDDGEAYEQLFLAENNTIHNSHFNESLSTTFIIHGYCNNINSDIIQLIKNALLTRGNQNVIGVDWGSIADTIIYTDAANAVKDVGNYVGQFILYMVGEGLDLNKTHLIGHSLGAHVAGFAGSSIYPSKVTRITGLDPAKPDFTATGPDQRLDISDADFVDCIHTCAGELGLGEPICSADFYPNFGTNFQPGCPLYDVFGTCSHSRSYEYYAESILKGHYFHAQNCSEVPLHDNNSCTPSDALMGYPASPRFPGIFYVVTHDKYPFSAPFDST